MKLFQQVKLSLTKLEFIKFKILFSLLFIGYLRATYFILIYFSNPKTSHLVISLLGIIVTSFFIFYIIKNPKKTTNILHLGIIVTYIGMLYRIFFVNEFLITQIQTTFLITMWSFYGLGKKWGIIYSCLFITVFPLHVANNGFAFNLFSSQEYYYFTWVIFFYNMGIIIYVPYLYQKVIIHQLKKKQLVNDNLKKSISSNKEFSSVITHELRTPLNSVLGIANLLHEKSKNEKEKTDIDTLQKSANELMNLINKILTFNKINTEQTQIENKLTDIPKLIDECIESKNSQIQEKNINIKFQIDAILKQRNILTDTNYLLPAITNLLEKLIQYSPNNSTIYIEAFIKEEDLEHGHFYFSISNTEIKIKPSKLEILFEPFYEIKKLNNNTKDSGLELAIVKKALENLNTQIQIFNHPHLGIQFHFNIPTKLSCYKNMTSLAELSITNEDITNLKILIVDDNIINIGFMQSLLMHWGNKPILATNGSQAVDIVKETNIDIVLMDLYMPVLSGFETSLQIRNLHKKIKQPYIIAVSAINKSDVEDELIENGINDFLSKPFKKEILLQKITSYNAISKAYIDI